MLANSINLKVQLLTAAVIVLVLSGCASDPMRLGITESEWENYSPDKQQTLLANYKGLAQEYQYHAAARKKEKGVVNDMFLEVDIHDGQVMMPPFNNWYYYKPVNFVIFKDQCRDVILQQATDEKSQIELGVCYLGNILYLDPSHYDLTKKNGSISINSSPLWLSGFSYKGISSSGYVRLNNVTVEITQKENTSRQ